MARINSVLIRTKGNKNLEKVVAFFGEKASINMTNTGVIVEKLGCLSTWTKEALEKACDIIVLSATKF